MSLPSVVIDAGLGVVVGGSALVFGGAQGWQGWALALLAGVAGGLWRRPWWALVASVLATLFARLVAGLPSSDNWNVAMALLLAGAFGLLLRPAEIAVGIAVLALEIALPGSFNVSDLLWLGVCLGGSAVVTRVASGAWRRAADERGRVTALAAVDAEVVAQRAVQAERVRLAVEVHRVVLAAVVEMRGYGARAAAAAEPGAAAVALRQVQRLGQDAIAELRGLLGLLRESPTADDPEPVVAATARRRWLRFVNLWLGGILIVVALLEFSVAVEAVPGDAVVVAPWSAVLAAAGAGTVCLRGVAPGLGAALLGGVFLLCGVLGVAIAAGLWIVPAVGILTWSAAYRRTVSGFVGICVLGVGGWVFIDRMAPGDQDMLIEVIVGVAAMALVTADRSTVARSAAVRAERLAAEQAELSEAAVRAERVTVARDLHDVVSHAVVVMVVQAGAAEAQLVSAPAAARQALAVIEQTAVTALGELDQLLYALTELDSRAPLSLRRDLRDLVERIRAGGLDVTLHAADPAMLRVSAAEPVIYRVVQEALTNALRHAAGSHVTVTISSAREDTVVEIVDDGPGATVSTRRGYGLIGLAERVQRLGGEVRTGPGPSGHGFRVWAAIPAVRPGART